MNKNFVRVGAVAAIAFAAVGGLTACSNATPAPSESSEEMNVVSPIQIPVAEANGNTYDIPMNSTGYLNVADGSEADWTAEFEQTDTAAKVSPEVEVTKFSLGATFEFEPRRSLPLTVV
jgi:hypothetical protein